MHPDFSVGQPGFELEMSTNTEDSQKRRATVFVVDSDPAVRTSLRQLVESAELHAECHTSAQEFLDAFGPKRPGCLVSDVRLPGMSGLQLQERLRELGISLPTIFLTGHGDVATAVRAMKAGAVDFFEKPFNSQVLLESIWKAVELAYMQHRRREQELAAASRLSLLSARERQVLDLVVAGQSSKQIAASLALSLKTVENHRASILEKVGATNVVDLVRLVLTLKSNGGRIPDRTG